MGFKMLGAAAKVICGGLIAVVAQAQGFPDKPVTMVVPQAPGGANDIVARLYAKEMGATLGQSVVVDNRPGAGGNIGTAAVARTAPTGYTVLMTVNSTQAINPLLYKNAGFDPVKDFAPIGTAGLVPNVLLVNREVKAETLEDFLAEAKARPGQIRYGSAGNGTLPHLMGAMLAAKAGVVMMHIPYKGIGPALTDVLAGHIQAVFATMPAALPHIRSGALRALAVTSAQRTASLPDVPALAEKFPGYQGVLWIALYAPAGTPPEAMDRLVQAFNAARSSRHVRLQLAEICVAALDEGPEQLHRRLAGEITQWSAVIRENKVEIN